MVGAVACEVRGPGFNSCSFQCFLSLQVLGGSEKMRTFKFEIVRCFATLLISVSTRVRMNEAGKVSVRGI